MAPGPPETRAVAQPAMLPVPTWAAIAVVSAWKELMPSLPALSPRRVRLPKTRPKADLNFLTCTKFVRMVKKMPVPTSRKRSRFLSHRMPFTAFTILFKVSTVFISPFL